jgi:hypothetical protein
VCCSEARPFFGVLIIVPIPSFVLSEEKRVVNLAPEQHSLVFKSQMAVDI